MRTRYWQAGLQFILAVVAACAAYALRLEPQESPNWFSVAALWLKPVAPEVILSTAVLLAFLQALEVVVGRHFFRRATIRRCLDTLVSELGGKARRNRVTVFKRVGASRALVTCLWRLGIAYWKEENRRKFSALVRSIRGWNTYLIVYVRSSGARNQRSAVALKVSDRGGECEGVAGLAWEEGFVIRPKLPHLNHSQVDRLQSLDELRERRKNDPVRKYVERTGIKSLEQLRAFQQYARHFMGHIIKTQGGAEWGVLLLDSEEDVCPFPTDEPNGGCFGRQFRAYAEILGNLLR